MKKERLYIHTLIDEPIVNYPAYYLLSSYQHTNEGLRDTIIALHTASFDDYGSATNHYEIFDKVMMGQFVIYKQTYIVGYFGGKLMYLASDGWHAMVITQGIFEMEHWLI
jgi:hypothetical protein